MRGLFVFLLRRINKRGRTANFKKPCKKSMTGIQRSFFAFIIEALLLKPTNSTLVKDYCRHFQKIILLFSERNSSVCSTDPAIRR